MSTLPMSTLPIKVSGELYKVELSPNSMLDQNPRALDSIPVALRVLKSQFLELGSILQLFSADSMPSLRMLEIANKVLSYVGQFNRLFLIPDFCSSVIEISQDFQGYSTAEKIGRVVGTAGMGIYASTFFIGSSLPFLFTVSAVCELTSNLFEIAFTCQDLDLVYEMQEQLATRSPQTQRNIQQLDQTLQTMDDKEQLLKWQLLKTTCGMIGMAGILMAGGGQLTACVATGFSVVKAVEGLTKFRVSWIKESTPVTVAWKKIVEVGSEETNFQKFLSFIPF